jgi:hypothetical protein
MEGRTGLYDPYSVYFCVMRVLCVASMAGCLVTAYASWLGTVLSVSHTVIGCTMSVLSTSWLLLERVLKRKLHPVGVLNASLLFLLSGVVSDVVRDGRRWSPNTAYTCASTCLLIGLALMSNIPHCQPWSFASVAVWNFAVQGLQRWFQQQLCCRLQR